MQSKRKKAKTYGMKKKLQKVQNMMTFTIQGNNLSKTVYSPYNFTLIKKHYVASVESLIAVPISNTHRYDIVYKQAVTSEDMFLGMSNKTPATASCENMTVSALYISYLTLNVEVCLCTHSRGSSLFQVKITLPDTKFADVKLDVKDKFLDCRTPK